MRPGHIKRPGHNIIKTPIDACTAVAAGNIVDFIAPAAMAVAGNRAEKSFIDNIKCLKPRIPNGEADIQIAEIRAHIFCFLSNIIQPFKSSVYWAGGCRTYIRLANAVMRGLPDLFRSALYINVTFPGREVKKPALMRHKMKQVVKSFSNTFSH